MFEELPEEVRGQLRKSAPPSAISPMLATLTDQPFSDPAWIYEPKLDGIRCVAFRRGRSVRLVSRNQKDLSDTYPELVQALRRQNAADFIVDGEVVALEGEISSFARLQQRMRSGIGVFYYLSDLLYLEGYDTTRLPLRQRKMLLKRALSWEDPLRFTPHRDAEGEAFYREACKKGWEGILAKRASSPYVPTRSRDWLKFKCVLQQEFVIGGYTDPQGQRVGFGALLVGYFENGQFRYAGKVGTGYDTATLRELIRRLAPLESKVSPFSGADRPRGNVHWVKPKVVAQVGFTEWTRDGKLRHPRFLGLRSDKHPAQVLRESVGRPLRPRRPLGRLGAG